MFFTKTWGGYWQEKMREQMEGLFHVQGHTKNYRSVPSQDSSNFQENKTEFIFNYNYFAKLYYLS